MLREAGGRLGERLARFVGLARGLVRLVLVFGDELRQRLGLFALQFADRGVGLDQLALVGSERGLRALQFLLGVVEVDLGADPEVDRLLAGGDALGQRVDQRRLVGDAHTQPLQRRLLLGDLLVERAQRVGELAEVGRQHRFLARLHAVRQRLVPVDLALRIGGERVERRQGRAVLGRLALRLARRVDRQPAAGDFAQARLQRLARLALVGGGFRGVELEQQVAGLDRLAVFDPDGGDLAGIERLDDLDPPGRLELAGRDGVDVEPAEERPGERRREDGADRQHRRDRQRRGRGLEDLQRRRQELAVAAGDGRDGAAAGGGARDAHRRPRSGSDCSAHSRA